MNRTTGFKLIEGMAKDRFPGQGNELFPGSLHETLTPSGGDNDCTNFHNAPGTEKWKNGLMKRILE
jgi:hypothetical protein